VRLFLWRKKNHKYEEETDEVDLETSRLMFVRLRLWNIFHFSRLSRPRAPLQEFSLNTANNSLNKMPLGHLVQFNEIYCDERPCKVLQICVIILGLIFRQFNEMCCEIYCDERPYKVLQICLLILGLIFLFTLCNYLSNTHPQLHYC